MTFSEFIRNATDAEREAVYAEVIKAVTILQDRVNK